MISDEERKKVLPEDVYEVTRHALKSNTNMETAPVIVLELFTSQGCSSCPPADKVLGKYAESNDNTIFPLSFYVDYWNYIGWDDPYSRQQFTQRQQQYAKQLKASVYTPQLFINGKQEVIGSDSNKIAALVAAVSRHKATVQITGNAIVKQEKAMVSYTLEGSSEDENINIALVRKKVSTKVQRGKMPDGNFLIIT